MQTTLTNKLIAAVAGFAAVLAVSHAWTQPAASQPEIRADQVVVVSAKRLTTEEKIAFDTQGQLPQQVIISAHRMTEQEQIAFDTASQLTQQVVISAHKMSAQEKMVYDQAHQADVAQAERAGQPG